MQCRKCMLSDKNYVPTFCSSYGGEHDFSIVETRKDKKRLSQVTKLKELRLLANSTCRYDSEIKRLEEQLY